MRKNLIASFFVKSKKHGTKIKKAISIPAVSLLIFYAAFAAVSPSRAIATGTPDPNISGGGSSSGNAGQQISVTPGTPIQVSGTGTISVQISVPSGYLHLNTTTGLTFFTNKDVPSKSVVFKGSVADINAALATLEYLNATSGNYTITAYVLPENMFYNPVNGHYYKSVSGGSYNFNEALAGSAATTFQGTTGYLATVTSDQENQFIFDNVNQENWIAANDLDSPVDKTFKWVAGPEAVLLFGQVVQREVVDLL